MFSVRGPKVKYFALVMAAIAIAAGVYMTFFESAGYVKTQATIVSIVEVPSDLPDETSDHIVTVDYVADGLRYTTELDMYSGTWKEGKTITVYYDPSNPSVVHGGKGFGVYLMVLGVVIIAVVIVGSKKNKVFPSFLVAFTTASSMAAYSTSVDACTKQLGIPGFIADFIAANTLYHTLYQLLYVIMLLVQVAYIFAMNFYLLEKSTFAVSCRKSRRLIAGKYFQTLLFLAALSCIINTIVVVFSASVSASVSALTVQALSLFSSGLSTTDALRLASWSRVISQLIGLTIAPAVNIAALTTLSFRYVEDRNMLARTCKISLPVVE